MLDIVTFRWKPPAGYRSKFGPETVNTLARMVRRHYQSPHRFSVITDDPVGIDSSIRIIPLWDDYADLPSPHGASNPSCFRRLRLFSSEMRDLIGPRIAMLDLDVVITRDMGPIWNRKEDFVIWGDTSPGTPYNGSMTLQTAGARAQVWDTFHPIFSPMRAKQKGYFGSDQAWIGACLGPDEAKWTTHDGVYSFRNHLLHAHRSLPSMARIIILHGKHDPWDSRVQRDHPWIGQHYR